MKCGRRVFQDYARDPVRPCVIVVRGVTEGFLHYSRGDLSGKHREWGSGRECGVTVSSFVSCLTTSAGVVMRRPDVSSFKMERSVGSMVGFLSPAADQRIDFSATLGFFTNMRRKALP